jgi:hypothetical protein
VRHPPLLSPDDLREFVRRDRSQLERLKREHWAEQRRERGPAVTLRIGHALYEHARRVLPNFPDPQMRSEDLRDHIALKQKIDRAARAFALR